MRTCSIKFTACKVYWNCWWGPPRGFAEQGHLYQGNKGTYVWKWGEQMQFWGIGNIENQDFGEQGNSDLFQGNKGTDTTPTLGRALEWQPQASWSAYHIYSNKHSLSNRCPLPLFMEKRWPNALGTKIVVYLPAFCLKNVVFRTRELQCPWGIY